MSSETISNKAAWQDIISRIDSNFKLFALIVLITEALLVYLATRVNESQSFYLSLLIAGILIVVIAATVMIYYLDKKTPTSLSIPKFGRAEIAGHSFKYDVFIAAPMAGLPGDLEYQKTRDDILKIIAALERECGFKSIFFAGKQISSIHEFESENLSLIDDFKAIRDSRFFVMIYLDKVVSSVLVEAGVALAMGKPTIFFGDRENLPYLLRASDQALKHVKVYEDASVTNIIQRICINRNRIFESGGLD